MQIKDRNKFSNERSSILNSEQNYSEAISKIFQLVLVSSMCHIESELIMTPILNCLSSLSETCKEYAKDHIVYSAFYNEKNFIEDIYQCHCMNCNDPRHSHIRSLFENRPNSVLNLHKESREFYSSFKAKLK